MTDIVVGRVDAAADRLAARQVFSAVYVAEKGWCLPTEDPFADDADTSWFLVRDGAVPAGVLRLRYDPPVVLPVSYRATVTTDVSGMMARGAVRLVDIGRFMIVPAYRRRPRIALTLMGAAIGEVVRRGSTHLVTDVFEGERHSPLDFHVRVLGFEIIGWHDQGDHIERLPGAADAVTARRGSARATTRSAAGDSVTALPTTGAEGRSPRRAAPTR